MSKIAEGEWCAESVPVMRRPARVRKTAQTLGMNNPPLTGECYHRRLGVLAGGDRLLSCPEILRIVDIFADRADVFGGRPQPKMTTAPTVVPSATA
jgi:hypothetical protein